MIDHPPGWLDDAAWALIQRQVPVTCVDLVPIRAGAVGVPLEPGLIELGLIERQSPFGVRWCQIGGRLRLGETIRAGCYATSNTRSPVPPSSCPMIRNRTT